LYRHYTQGYGESECVVTSMDIYIGISPKVQEGNWDESDYGASQISNEEVI